MFHYGLQEWKKQLFGDVSTEIEAAGPTDAALEFPAIELEDNIEFDVTDRKWMQDQHDLMAKQVGKMSEKLSSAVKARIVDDVTKDAQKVKVHLDEMTGSQLPFSYFVFCSVSTLHR